MSKQSSILRPTLVLGLITLVVSAVLVLTYNITGVGVAGPAISDEMLAAAAEILPGGEGFDDAGVGSSVSVPAVIGTSNDAGYVINAMGKGYGGDLSVLIGLDKDGKVTGIKVLESAETPGIGTKVTEDEAFLSSFIGKDSVDGSDVVSGATFSSKALNEAVTNAFDAFNTIKSGGQLEGGSAPSTSEGDKEETETPVIEEEVAELTIEDVIAAAPEVLAGGEGFEDSGIEATDSLKSVLKTSNAAGYVVNVVSEGFGGEMNVIVGFDAEKKITGVKILAMQETEGLGTLVGEPDVLDKLVGKAELDEEVAVSGATVSSEALNTAIKAAIEAVKGVDA